MIVAALSGLQVVDENSTDWSQVLEFRRDEGAKRKYRRFRHWFDAEMVGKSRAFIEDEIAIRLEDYDWAVRKHGLKTVPERWPRFSTRTRSSPAPAAAITVNVAAGHWWAAAAFAGVVAGKGLLSVGEMLIDWHNIRRSTHPEIAFVHDARRELGCRAPSKSRP